ncbi:MAG: endolytic transglycosylase MltG [Pseudomonadota bacterium]
MWKSLAANTITVIIALLLTMAVVIGWGQAQYRGGGPLEQAICLQVKSGSNMSLVSEDLAEQGAISSASIFRLGADYSGKAPLLKAGSFLVLPGSSMEQIVEVVTKGGRSTCGTEINYRIGVLRAQTIVRELDPNTNRYVDLMSFQTGEEVPANYAQYAEASDTRFRVTLAEGVTSWQVVETLKAAGFLEGTVEEVPGEGMLAPDSYEVTRGSERADLLARMQEAQERILADLWAARAPGLPLQTPEEALVLASIIEKETAVADERPQVSSVFINRLNRGMRLQTDPTVIYGITEGRGSLGRGLRVSELRGATPYNTYVIQGLPPGPIANPGRESIAAALDPAATDLLFFVADGTGGHAFAETLEEHNRNVAKWREIERERQNN